MGGSNGNGRLTEPRRRGLPSVVPPASVFSAEAQGVVLRWAGVAPRRAKVGSIGHGVRPANRLAHRPICHPSRTMTNGEVLETSRRRESGHDEGMETSVRPGPPYRRAEARLPEPVRPIRVILDWLKRRSLLAPAAPGRRTPERLTLGGAHFVRAGAGAATRVGAGADAASGAGTAGHHAGTTSSPARSRAPSILPEHGAPAPYPVSL